MGNDDGDEYGPWDGYYISIVSIIILPIAFVIVFKLNRELKKVKVITLYPDGAIVAESKSEN